MNRAALARPARTGTGTPLVKAIAIAASAFTNKRHLKTELPNWRGDTKDVELIVRAAASSRIADPKRLGRHAGDDHRCGLRVGARSVIAGSVLLKRGLQFQFNGAAQINVPTIVAAASNTSFVKEGDPIPNRQLSFTGPSLSPRKFATLSTFTREVLNTVRQPSKAWSVQR